ISLALYNTEASSTAKMVTCDEVICTSTLGAPSNDCKVGVDLNRGVGFITISSRWNAWVWAGKFFCDFTACIREKSKKDIFSLLGWVSRRRHIRYRTSCTAESTNNTNDSRQTTCIKNVDRNFRSVNIRFYYRLEAAENFNKLWYGFHPLENELRENSCHSDSRVHQ
ncbi:hypothetical protein Tco_1355654, partial [Tanacetum coccineum]